jgi:hypothetical protein
MEFCFLGVKNHQSDKNYHVGKPVKRRVEEAAKPRHAARKSRDLAIKHVKEVSNNENDTGTKEPAEAKEQTATYVQGHANDSEYVWVDMAMGKPTHHRIDDSLRAAPDAGSKHLLIEFSFSALCPKTFEVYSPALNTSLLF